MCSAAKAAPEEVPGAVSGSKAEPKGGKNGSIDFFLGPLGAPYWALGGSLLAPWWALLGPLWGPYWPFVMCVCVEASCTRGAM
mgnify:CR=1 FL=1